MPDTHDAWQFIVIHQASELWFKLCRQELAMARQAIISDRPGTAFKMMARVARVQQQVIQSWDVLATITPADYSAMRGKLGGSSGSSRCSIGRSNICWARKGGDARRA